MVGRPFGIFVLGAGFSKPAGMPLGTELLAAVLEEKKRLDKYPIIDKDLKRFCSYQERVRQQSLSPKEINLEEFISFLDIEHYLGLKGRDTWSEEGNPSQIAIRNLIARVLHKRQGAMTEEDFVLYDRFVDRLEPCDIVITFNYDTILETSLDRKNKRYRLVPERNHAELDEPEFPTDEDVIVLKMHGSIDWFDIAPFHKACQSRRSEEHYQHPRNAIFNEYRRYSPTRIAGSYYERSPLSGIYRVSDVGAFFDDPARGLESPLILSPSFSKVLYMNPLRDLWYSFYSLGAHHSRFVVIGFSMAAHDEYVRQPIANGIVNFQDPDVGDPRDDGEKLKIVDYRAEEQDISDFWDHYSFVDRSRAECCFAGFNDEALEMIFSRK